MFKTAGADFEEALESQFACIYLRDGLMVDAVVGGSENSIYVKDAEEALAMIVRLATWVSLGVCASGYTVTNINRPERLSVTSNSGKFLSIVASDEEGHDRPDEERGPDALSPLFESTPETVSESVSSSGNEGSAKAPEPDSTSKDSSDNYPQPHSLTTQ